PPRRMLGCPGAQHSGRPRVPQSFGAVAKPLSGIIGAELRFPKCACRPAPLKAGSAAGLGLIRQHCFRIPGRAGCSTENLDLSYFSKTETNEETASQIAHHSTM